MAVIIVGKAQPKSKRLNCSRCGALLEYLEEDVQVQERFRYVACPSKSCKNQNYLGTVEKI